MSVAAAWLLPALSERRQKARLRKIFPEACIRIAPCIFNHPDWQDSIVGFQAERWVKRTYPYLSSEEVQELLNSIASYVQLEFPTDGVCSTEGKQISGIDLP